MSLTNSGTLVDRIQGGDEKIGEEEGNQRRDGKGSGKMEGMQSSTVESGARRNGAERSDVLSLEMNERRRGRTCTCNHSH